MTKSNIGQRIRDFGGIYIAINQNSLQTHKSVSFTFCLKDSSHSEAFIEWFARDIKHFYELDYWKKQIRPIYREDFILEMKDHYIDDLSIEIDPPPVTYHGHNFVRKQISPL